ncbi:MAG: GCN5-related N-acetyltransferase [Mahella sp.]|nr:GNAT family N-acetyltransferase [Mahella sp.]MBZ4665049.1 GCN5-related N-acetyltransferase [Mahella sp.]
MTHKGTVTLETERLILRRFTMDDAEPMFRNWASDPEVTKYLTWPTHKNVDISREVIKNWLSAYESERKYEWAIELKSLHEPIGSISAVKVEDNTNLVHIGYCIGRPWWHKGYTSEALTRLVRFFFEEVGANRIEACFDPRNRNSGKVMAKAGLKYEGTMRQANRNNQGICDAAYYAILADDYFGKGQKRGISIGDISIDCADPARTRDFYAALTGWEKREAYGCPALVGDNGLLILFTVPEVKHVPPVWPEEAGKQQKQMHFNFQVDDLPAVANEAIRLGATKAAKQFGGEHFVTMLDPEGHPFCLCAK